MNHQEILAQLTQGNGHETEATRGLTLRELVLEVRSDVAHLKENQARFITKEQAAGALVAVAMLVLGIINAV